MMYVSDKKSAFDARISLIIVSNEITIFHAGILRMQHVDF